MLAASRFPRNDIDADDMSALEFARLPARSHESCAGFVARWLHYRGVDNAPTPCEILRAWRTEGIRDGLARWCARLGLESCAPEENAIALAEQDGGGLLIGVLMRDGWFVTRSFGAVARLKPRLVACWRIRGGPNV